MQSNRNLNETVGGMNILTASANKVENYQLRTWIETWAEPVLRQVTLLEQEYETDDIILSLAGRKAELPQKFGIDAVTDDLLQQELTLNINVGLGLTSPQEQVNRFMFGLSTLRDILADGVLERYGLKISEVIKEIFGKLGYKSGGRFFDENQDPAVTGLKAMVQQLEQRLAMKQDPELTKAQIRKVMAEIVNIQAERVKKGVESAYSAMQAAGVIAATPQTAPIADTVMAAAGYRVPVPPGVDPNFGTQGGAPLSEAAPEVPANPHTHPNLPQPPMSAGDGVERGIETPAVDAVPA